jgi:hypothetical protein
MQFLIFLKISGRSLGELNKESVTREVVHRLGDYLLERMPMIRQVIHDFPEANIQLQYPCISIFSNEPEFSPQMAPYEYSSTQVNNTQYEFLYVVGMYEWQIQVDIWCQTKEQRHKLYDQFFRAFNSQFPIMGLSLNLTDYYDIICRYDQVALNFNTDGEAAAQRKEWRVKIDLLGNCKAIVDRSEFAILTTEINVDDVRPDVEIEE